MNAARQIVNQQVLQVGSVSYLNAKPLIYGLENAPDLRLHLQVPSGLLDGLVHRRLDVALLPVIDYQRHAGLCIVPGGAIGCDGPTLTVRIFSKVPIDRIGVLACDTDSHTSVALARIILARRFARWPRLIDLSAPARGRDEADAMLLIGDKVVCHEPLGMDHQLDLGEAWKELTGRPFVFAVWTARQGVDLGDLPRRLSAARRQGLDHVAEIIAGHGVPRGWPADLALQYLTQYLKFDFGAAQIDAMRHFHRLAAEEGLIESPCRELAMYL